MAVPQVFPLTPLLRRPSRGPGAALAPRVSPAAVRIPDPRQLSLDITFPAGQPQIFVDADTLRGELARAGFAPDPSLPLIEHNAPTARTLHVAGGGPVIYEGGFCRRS